ncbi:SsgA family sporulation/cell division regulator [Streptomyces sp. 1331.2]|uniref:SsgA family sporulation/cell division regulator n=1 Tax=Streptomyces sp. 1331.2 TaxID=1938835 RepID=UPI000BD5D763|nr:Streptomyces sporulation and cell division protein, SsgA [Streptomyces sp. 1331.2]
MQHSTVQGHLEMSLVVSHELSFRILADLAYETADPYAVRFTFHLPGDAPVTWFFARELLLDGLSGPAGDGDVHIHPYAGEREGASEWEEPSEREEVRILLRSPAGEALLRAPSAPLAAFLARIDRLVRPAREFAAQELEARLAEILRGRENAG